jgi:hypothetical protein
MFLADLDGGVPALGGDDLHIKDWSLIVRTKWHISNMSPTR